MSGYFSDDAESWTPVGEHTVSGTITEVGLIAGRAQLEPAVAEFDYFTLSPQGTATDATPATVSTQSSAIPATESPIIAGEHEFAVTGPRVGQGRSSSLRCGRSTLTNTIDPEPRAKKALTDHPTQVTSAPSSGRRRCQRAALHNPGGDGPSTNSKLLARTARRGIEHIGIEST